MKAIADEAHMWGLKVAAHAHGASGIRDAIRAGIDTIEHASLIDDEGIALAKEHGTWLSMDIYNTDYTQAEGAKNGVIEDNLRKDREIAQLQRENFRAAHRAGVKMVFGTDAGSSARQRRRPVRDHGPLRHDAAAGDPVRDLQRRGGAGPGEATSGAIAAGRYGDLIAVSGDPLADVRRLETVPVVIKGGAVVVFYLDSVALNWQIRQAS